MGLADDTEYALERAAALVNTEGRDSDALSDLAGLVAFVRDWGPSGPRRATRADLDEVRALRSRLRLLWSSEEDALVTEVNAILREAGTPPQLVQEERHYILSAPPGASLTDRIAVETGMAFIDVVRAGELARLEVCGAWDCEDVIVDLSRNRSRRYCSSACLSRVNVAAFRARRR